MFQEEFLPKPDEEKGNGQPQHQPQSGGRDRLMLATIGLDDYAQRASSRRN
jgi:hypothetical protein